MNAPVPLVTARSERRLARWILAALLLLITPIALIGVGVASFFGLNRDAALLKREVMAASDSDWNTTVQLNVGLCTLAAARTVLRFADVPDVEDARLALASVRRASVGVYQRIGRARDWSREQLIARTDERMTRRGWSRLVGVLGDDETVLIYASDELDSGGKLDLCLAVIDGEEMVIVSTKIDADALADLAGKHIPEGGLRGKLGHAKVRI
jgi:hypothetical protein